MRLVSSRELIMDYHTLRSRYWSVSWMPIGDYYDRYTTDCLWYTTPSEPYATSWSQKAYWSYGRILMVPLRNRPMVYLVASLQRYQRYDSRQLVLIDSYSSTYSCLSSRWDRVIRSQGKGLLSRLCLVSNQSRSRHLDTSFLFGLQKGSSSP